MTITEVSRKMDISADTLRYYEKIGLIPKIKRNKNGIRDYSEDDLKTIEFVKCMRASGLSIEMLIKYISLFMQGDETLEIRKSLLEKERDKLSERINEMQKTLDRLNYKIEGYENKLLKKEQSLRKIVMENK